MFIVPGTALADPPYLTIDLAVLGTPSNVLTRVHGADNIGSAGVPVFGGHDVDGDGHLDYGLCGFQANPLGRSGAGLVTVVFGNGTLGEAIHTGVYASNILRIAGAQAGDRAGSEAWMDDVTGDGVGDLLICRQAANFTNAARTAAGALTIIKGGPELRAFAMTSNHLDLAAIPTNITAVSFYGESVSGRLGIWVRTGDVDGDGTPDIAVGEDQNDIQGSNAGAVYVIRGGGHLASNAVIDMASFGTSALAPHIARILPPAGAPNYHLGATLTIGDLDGDGMGEVVAAATLNRAGAGGSFSPGGTGSSGFPYGKLFIAWGRNFLPAYWTNGYDFAIDAAPEGFTAMRGGNSLITASGTPIAGSSNHKFGEELLAGRDYNGDGKADLFVGDITGRAYNRQNSGVGWVFFSAGDLKGADIAMNFTNTFPSNFFYTVFVGPMASAISSDTASHGDYNDDGIDDLLIGNPCNDSAGRSGAGSINIIFGRTNAWPEIVDLASGQFPPTNQMTIYEIWGVKANDTLCYSAADGDADGDGISDILINEMNGDNPFNGQNNAGNLLVISGARIGAAAALDLQIHAAEDPIVSAPLASYTVVVANTSVTEAVGVTVRNLFPPGTSVDTGTVTVSTGSLGYSGSTSLVWTIGSIAAGGSVTGIFPAAIDASAALILTNTGDTGMFGLDLFPSNNTVILETSILDSDGDSEGNIFDPDDDNDQIPDAWETANGLNTTNSADASVDQDSDSFTAFEEYIADTLPQAATSVFAFAASTTSPGMHEVRWSSSTNRLYHLYAAPDLTGGSWSQVMANIVATNSTTSIVMTNNTDDASYYRVDVLIP